MHGILINHWLDEIVAFNSIHVVLKKYKPKYLCRWSPARKTKKIRSGLRPEFPYYLGVNSIHFNLKT